MEGTHLYLVEMNVKPRKIEIFIDGYNGVNIHECGELSSYIHRRMEDDGIDIGEYNVEVSSPGIDRALDGIRDYKKNTGRKLLVRNNQNKLIKGTLVYVDETRIVLSTGNNKNEKLDFNQIKEAKIVI